MKITVLLASLALFTGFVFGQNLPVSQLPETKKAVIEEFTAFRCGNCPLGHQLTNTIGDNLGEDNVLVIAYHAGSLAVPQSAGDPDFRTADGDQMQNHFSVAGTPSGPVNRSSFGTSNYVTNANNWSSNSTSEVAITADANVALNAAIDHYTREVTINTEVYYNTNSTNTHYLTVGYLEEGVIAAQTSYNATWNSAYFYPNGDYYHRHIFRGFVNSAEGDTLDANSTSVISNDYTFSVPTEINGQPIDIYSLEFFAIIHEGLNGPTDSEIINAAKTIDPFVNIKEIEPRDIIVAPNPNNGSFLINGLEESDVLIISDLSGRTVEFVREGNQIEIATSGYYLLHVVGDNNSSTVAFTVK